MKHILTLNEYRNQLEIPFDNKHPLHGKPTHAHVIDALAKNAKRFMDVDEYKTVYTDSDIYKMWNDHLDKGLNLFRSNIDQCISQVDVNVAFIEEYLPTQNPEYYNEDIQNDVNVNKLKDKDIIEKYNLYDDLENCVSEEGANIMDSDEFYEPILSDRLNHMNVDDKLAENITKNGVIPIWRAITYTKANHVDTYEYAVKYKGTGVFWSYDRGGAVAHWGDKEGEVLVLHAYVSPENIDWAKTIYKSAWHLNEEQEIQLKSDTEVLVYRITNEDDKGVTLKKAILIST